MGLVGGEVNASLTNCLNVVAGRNVDVSVSPDFLPM